MMNKVVNQSILLGLEHFKKKNTTGMDSVKLERMLAESISLFTGFPIITSKDFRTKFKTFSSRISASYMELTGLPDCVIQEPNGTQSWPDVLIVNNGKVLPIEIKSSKTGRAVWNSGLPRQDCLYFYSNFETGSCSTFLGHHVSTEENNKNMKLRRIALNEFKQKLDAQYPISSEWDDYIRPMYNCGNTKLNTVELKEFIPDYKWDKTTF